MRGGFLHNTVLLGPIEAYVRGAGALSIREYPVGPGGVGFVDLFVIHRGYRIVCEAETSPDRVCNDLAKAVLLKADLLLIVVPTGRVARAARRRLRRLTCLGAEHTVDLFLGTLGQAVQRLGQLMIF